MKYLDIIVNFNVSFYLNKNFKKTYGGCSPLLINKIKSINILGITFNSMLSIEKR